MSETLAEIYDDYRSDRNFDHLRLEGIVLVPGEGASSNAKVLIVGEAPGATENTHRRPFVGASGIVLRSLIVDSAGLAEGEYFITNVVKYRPPGNRTPTETEIMDSIPYLRREYRAIGTPSVMIAVGAVAFAALKPSSVKGGILANAGERFYRGGDTCVIPMIHPAYGLRSRSVRPTMEKHWENFGEWFRNAS